jgi:hypothetical protein
MNYPLVRAAFLGRGVLICFHCMLQSWNEYI